jgi:hypothetical protein
MIKSRCECGRLIAEHEQNEFVITNIDTGSVSLLHAYKCNGKWFEASLPEVYRGLVMEK